VFNLGGGFHHAHREKGGGYCLINDIAIAREKYCNQLRCLIVDLDYHQGDGNLAIYEKNPHVFTFSMHAGYWLESSKTENLDILLPEYCDGNEYLRILSSTLPDLINTFDPQFIFYIAGSDPYIYDTLGDLALTRADMLRRNMFVFSLLKEKNIPGVVLAGGGYGDRSWEVYFDFISHSLRYRK
jgi:acetoin utilization deacetylase AcuC-like enzyme